MTAAVATDEEALLAAVLAAPADDTPRLVYADWLDEHGEPERAEFIRVQCELAATADPHADRFWDGQLGEGPESHRRRKALRRREQELWSLTCDRAGFVVPNPPGLIRCVLPGMDWFDDAAPRGLFRRGFVAELRLPKARFGELAGPVFRAHPVERVTLTGVAPHPWEWRPFASFFGPGRPLLVTPAEAYLPGPAFDRLPGPRVGFDSLRPLDPDPPTARAYRVAKGGTLADGFADEWVCLGGTSVALDYLSAALVAWGRELAHGATP